MARTNALIAVCVSGALGLVAITAAAESEHLMSKEERRDFIRRAQVWQPTTVPAMNLRLGPQGRDSFKPNARVTCEFHDADSSGHTPKFNCVTASGDTLKVRYGGSNGEVIGSVLASRLFWALGFMTDRVYPVRVTCKGCAADPWVDKHKVPGEQHDFDFAVVERKPEGHEMKDKSKESGWAWTELPTVDVDAGGAPWHQRDALTLLAVFVQHTDSKAEQQRLLCLPGALRADGYCQKPFLAIHDLGLTFGHSSMTNNRERSSVNFKEWSTTTVWRDPKACVGRLSISHTGTLNDPVISEAGRAFLGGLLSQLTDKQLRDLFEVARVNRRPSDPTDSESTVSPDVEQWVAAFKEKRDQITSVRCPN